jgi:hypothetical protein
MIDYTLIVGILALCFLWASWREHANDNRRDSRLLLALSVLTGLGSVGVAVST